MMHRIHHKCPNCNQESTILMRDEIYTRWKEGDRSEIPNLCGFCLDKQNDPHRSPTPAQVTNDILKRLSYIFPEDDVMRGVAIRAVVRDALNAKVAELAHLVDRLLVGHSAVALMLMTHMNSRMEK